MLQVPRQAHKKMPTDLIQLWAKHTKPHVPTQEQEGLTICRYSFYRTTHLEANSFGNVLILKTIKITNWENEKSVLTRLELVFQLCICIMQTPQDSSSLPQKTVLSLSTHTHLTPILIKKETVSQKG